METIVFPDFSKWRQVVLKLPGYHILKRRNSFRVPVYLANVLRTKGYIINTTGSSSSGNSSSGTGGTGNFMASNVELTVEQAMPAAVRGATIALSPESDQSPEPDITDTPSKSKKKS